MSVTAEELEIVIKGNIEDAVSKIESLKAKMNNVLSQATKPVQQMNTAFKSSGVTQNIDKTAKQMEILSREIAMQERKVDSLKKKYRNSFQSKSKSMVQDFRNQQKAQIQLDKMKLRYETMGNKTVPKVKDATEKVAKSTEKTTQKATKSTNILSKAFKRMLVMMAIRTVIKEAIQGFKDLAQYSTKFNKTMSNIQSSFLQARNSIITAFAPALQALEPIITRIANAISYLFNLLAKFNTALFTNSKTYTVAKKVTTDYAKSVAQAQKSLAGFDELNVISNQQTQGMPTAQEMFSTENIDEQTLNITEKIKQAISKAIANAKTQITEFIQWFESKFHIGALLNNVINLFNKMWTSIKKAYNKWGEPIFNELNKAITNTVDILSLLWNKVILPIIDSIIKFIGTIWDNLVDFLGNLINFVLLIYNSVIVPIISYLIDLLGPTIVQIIDNVLTTIAEIVNAIITIFNGIIEFLTGVFTGNWEKAWNGIKTIFKGIWDGMVAIVKGVVNSVIGMVNGMLTAMESGLNYIIDKINSLSFEVPEWVPGIGGQTWGFDIPNVTFPKIPKLKDGGILTRPTPVLAGEYPGARSNPEIVTPQKLLYETSIKANIPVINAVEEMGDKMTQALSNIGVYAEFGYDKLRVGLNKENARVGNKLYST